MTDSVASVSQLVAVIRRQLAENPDAGLTKFHAATRTTSKNSASPYRPDNLETLIRVRIKAIAPDDPLRGRKAFRAFLESVLLTHFGEKLINDPQFHQLIDEVQEAIEGDSAISGLLKTAMEHLTSV